MTTSKKAQEGPCAAPERVFRPQSDGTGVSADGRAINDSRRSDLYPETAEEAAREYRRVAKRLERLQLSASNFISRADNNQVFEVAWWLREVAKRIKRGYPRTDYRRLLK